MLKYFHSLISNTSFLITFVCLLALHASADSYITVTLTVTNTPQTSNTITVNGHLRTWTNATTAGTILTNSVGPGPAFTNLYNAFGNYPETATIRTYLSTNSMKFEGTNLSITLGGTWASLTGGSTQAIGSKWALMIPTDTLSQTNRTNNMSDLAYAIGRYSTNPITGIRLASPSMTNATSTNATIKGGTIINGTVLGDSSSSVELYNALINGGAIAFINSGATSAAVRSTLSGPVMTTGPTTSTALDVTAPDDTAVLLNYYSGIRLFPALQSGLYIGTNTWNIINRWYGTANTFYEKLLATNFWAYGAFLSNTVTGGTNQFAGDIAFPMASISTLANGNNLAAPFTNVFNAISGPSAAFSINGIYGGRDGRRLRLLNRSGQVMTIAHESGVDPTPANRITCSPANDQPFNDGEMVDLWYDGVSSRWRLSVHQTNAVTVATTNGIAAIWTNGVAVTSAGTNLNFLNPGGNGNLSIRATNTSGKVDLEIRDTTIGSSSGLGTNTAFYGAIVDNGTLNVLGLSTNTGVQNLWLNSSNITVNASNATAVPLTVKGISAGTGDLEQFADSSGYVIAGVRSNGLAFLSVSNSNVQYPACYRIFTQTADSACTNITTTETTWLGTGVGSLVLTQGFWQVGRRIEIEVDGLCWTDVSPGNEAVRLKLGSTVIATNFNVSVIANLASDPFHMRFALTCRTNSNIGFIVAQGEWEYPGAAGSATGRENFFKSADAIFDTTAAMTIDLVSTNGNALNSFRVRNFSAKLIP